MKSSANFSGKPSNLPNSGPTRRSFSLVGPGVPLDPRVNAVRRDLADLRLAQFVFAPHYAAPLACVANRRTDILPAADPGVEPLSEILPGETFELFEISRNYGWGMCDADGSVGFLDRAALDVAVAPPPPPSTVLESDFVAVAEHIVGTPFQPGGRSPLGVDAAGLIFYALNAVGTRPMRFLDLQATTLGHDVADAGQQRGDLIFFADHAAILIDSDAAIFAGAAAPVAILSLTELLTRDDIGPVLARRRLA